MKWINAAIDMPGYLDIQNIVFRRADTKTVVEKRYYNGKHLGDGIYFTERGSGERIPLKNIEWLNETSEYIHFFEDVDSRLFDPLPGIDQRLFVVLRVAEIIKPPPESKSYLYDSWYRQIFEVADNLIRKNDEDAYLDE